jgi:hypothetical protein
MIPALDVREIVDDTLHSPSRNHDQHLVFLPARPVAIKAVNLYAFARSLPGL